MGPCLAIFCQPHEAYDHIAYRIETPIFLVLSCTHEFLRENKGFRLSVILETLKCLISKWFEVKWLGVPCSCIHAHNDRNGGKNISQKSI